MAAHPHPASQVCYIMHIIWIIMHVDTNPYKDRFHTGKQRRVWQLKYMFTYTWLCIIYPVFASSDLCVRSLLLFLKPPVQHPASRKHIADPCWDLQQKRCSYYPNYPRSPFKAHHRWATPIFFLFCPSHIPPALYEVGWQRWDLWDEKLPCLLSTYCWLCYLVECMCFAVHSLIGWKVNETSLLHLIGWWCLDKYVLSIKLWWSVHQCSLILSMNKDMCTICAL